MLKRQVSLVGIAGLLALGAAATSRAQVASLVQDVQPGAIGSHPDGPVVMNGAVLFHSDDGVSGHEVWRTDGTAAGTTLVKDIRPGLAGGAFESQPLLVSGNVAWFSADDGTTGFELWRTDGTAAGTTLIKDIRPGPVGSFPILGAVVGGTLYFYASDGTNGIELWRSDGTSTGTVLVKDIRPGALSGPQGPLVVVGSTLYFPAHDDGTAGIELWKSDGTAGGTVLVKDLQPGSGHSSPTSLLVMGNAVWFVADDGASGVELWRSDGTAMGTAMVKDIFPGSGSGADGAVLAAAGGTLFFTATEGSAGLELWRSDGTAAGTSRVMDIQPGAMGSDPSHLTVVGTGVFFFADDGSHGAELWKSDGTAGGTVLVKDVEPGAGGGATRGFLGAFGNKVFFPADDGTAGLELWKSDGTATGTLMVEDLNPGAGSSEPEWVVALGSTFLSAQDDGTTGHEPWLLPTWALDTTPPSATPTVVGTLGGGGFYTSDISVTWAVADGDSPILRTTGCSPVTVSADTAGTTLQCIAVSGGGTTTGSVTLKRDTAPPALTCPADMVVDGAAPGGAVVSYSPATATDSVDPAPSISYSTPAGTSFPVGETVVDVTARDGAGYTATCAFKVTVNARAGGCGCDLRPVSGSPAWMMVFLFALLRVARRARRSLT